MHYRFCLFILLIATTFSGVSYAGGKDATVKKHEEYDSIPQIFRSVFSTNMLLEEYITHVHKLAFQNFPGKTQISQNDIDDRLEFLLASKRAQKLQEFVLFDRNSDAKVTQDEITWFYQQKPPGGSQNNTLERKIAEYMKNDLDKDGSISYAEAGQLEKERIQVTKNNRLSRVEKLLNEASNKEGILTLKNLKTLSEKFFKHLDLDNDDHLSEEEFSKYNDYIRKKGGKPKRPVYNSKKCVFEGFKPPQDFKIYATGTTKGQELPYRIKPDASRAIQVDIIVNEPNSPVVLILSSTRSTIWNIRQSVESNIIAVVAGEGDITDHVLVGLKQNVPSLIVNRSYYQLPCGRYSFVKRKLDNLNPLSRSLFNKPVDMFFPVDADHKVIFGDQDYNPENLLSFGDEKIETYFMKNYGILGVKKAVKEGKLREATEDDLKKWHDKLYEKSKSKLFQDIPPVFRENSLKLSVPQIPFYNAYVVLKEFEYPEGLLPDMVHFIVPEGVSVPKGDSGHSRTYDMNTMKCLGMGCRMTVSADRQYMGEVNEINGAILTVIPK